MLRQKGDKDNYVNYQESDLNPFIDFVHNSSIPENNIKVDEYSKIGQWRKILHQTRGQFFLQEKYNSKLAYDIDRGMFDDNVTDLDYGDSAGIATTLIASWVSGIEK